MLIKKCLVATALSALIVTAAFGLAARESSFGVAEKQAPAIEKVSQVAAPMQEGTGENCGFPDCNNNGVDDRCDLDCSDSGIRCVSGLPLDDDCTTHMSCGTSRDCNANGTPDECEGVECCSDSDCPRFWCCGQIHANQCNFCIE